MKQTNLIFKALAGLILIFSIILALISFVISPVCPVLPNGMHMSCYYSGILITCSGIILSIIAIVMIFVPSRIWRVVLSILVEVITLLSYMIPKQIIQVPVGQGMGGHTMYFGLCHNPEMNCHTSFGWSSLLMLGIVIVALIYLIFAVVSNDRKYK